MGGFQYPYLCNSTDDVGTNAANVIVECIARAGTGTTNVYV